ncbi:enolase C-terminal domain-like protein [Devosia sp.]|uniref:enolase C-terminal domain-like protein n=1 Tax=Devosia sp. TaxID=1871048 RepID=UPI001B1A2CA8|nr:enolase C-terminal domain-like protein [Devosia sp.]MBO9589811.1 D-galactonate dehydratase [Devosia sp.]
MKITGIETVVVNAIHRNWIFVKVRTSDAGLHGWGEATLEWKTKAVLGAIEDLSQFVIGEDPHRVEHLVQKMQRFSFWPLGAIGLTALSAIEQALWDIKGKALGVPVWQLLGGKVRDSVRVYTHLLQGRQDRPIADNDVSAFCDAVQETVEMGYTAIKLGFVPYTGYDAPLMAVKQTAKLAAAVRERVGNHVDILTDFHGRPDSVQAAKAFIDVIAPIRPMFVEEPIQPGDPEALAELSRQVDCPLATGERLLTPREYAELARLRAVTYVQPDLAHCGGFTGGRRIAAIAEAASMGVMPHNPMGPVAGAVALQFAVATPNFVIQEEAVALAPWYRDICQTFPIERTDGAWQVPTAPGLGIEIDETEAAKHPFAPEIIPALKAVLPDGRIANW